MKNLRMVSLLMFAFSIFLSGCSSTPGNASTGEIIDDTVITTRVKTAIFNDPDLKVAEINVETFKGVVQLSGFVSTRDEASRAGTLAGEVPGVVSIRNNIVLK
jgi:osmotically-inducible protein OsmY